MASLGHTELASKVLTKDTTELVNEDVIWDDFSASLPGLILGLHPANERRRYKVTPSLIGWAQI